MAYNHKRAQQQAAQQAQPEQMAGAAGGDVQSVKAVPINVNGRKVMMPAEKVVELIKDKLRKSVAVHALFDEFDLSVDRIDDLKIEIVPLDGKYAEADLAGIKINSMLFEDGDFFEKYMFILVHEICHTNSRILENEAYFNDPEEVLGFVASIAYELSEGASLDTVWNKVYDKVSFHFGNESDAKEFFSNMVEKAHELLIKFQNKKK